MNLREYWMVFNEIRLVDVDWFFVQVNIHLEPVTRTRQEAGLERWHTRTDDWYVQYDSTDKGPFITTVWSA